MLCKYVGDVDVIAYSIPVAWPFGPAMFQIVEIEEHVDCGIFVIWRSLI